MALLNFFRKPYKDVHDAIKSYENLYKTASKAIETFENDSDIEKNKHTEALFLNSLKEHYLNMADSGLDLDHIIENHLKSEDSKNKDKLSQFGTKLQKHSVLELNELLLSNKDIEIISFPEILNSDVFNHADKLHSIFKDHEETLIRIEQIKQILDKANKEKEVLNLNTFERCLHLNESNLHTYKLEFMKELKKTKIQLDKTMNFIPLPNEMNEETIIFHAYIRKLISIDIFTRNQVFKRFTNKIPDCLKEFEDKLGYFELNEEQVGIVVETKTKVA